MAHYPMFDNPKFDGKRKVPDFTNTNYKGANMPHFDGAHYDPKLDHARLTKQMVAVAEVMSDGVWRTIQELAPLVFAKTGIHYAHTGLDSCLRNFRKPRYGGHIKITRRRDRAERGIFEHKLTLVEA